MFEQPQYHLHKMDHIATMVDGLVQSITVNGLAYIRTHRLKTTVCDTVWQLYHMLPVGKMGKLDSQVTLDRQRDLVQVLTSELDFSADTQVIALIIHK